MAFLLPSMPRVGAQGEHKVTVRWDLMRPAANPVNAPRTLSLKEILAAHIGTDNLDGHEKMRAILRRDYEMRFDLLSRVPARARKLAWQIAGRYGVEPYLLFGQTRTRRATMARQELCYRLKQCGFTLPQVARMTLRRDHTTVLHAVRAHEARLAAGEVPREAYDEAAR